MALVVALCLVPAGVAVAAQDEGGSRVDQLIADMSMDEKVSQMIVPAMRTWDGDDVTSLDNAPALAQALQKHAYGGVILFGANIESAGQTARLTAALQANNAQAGGLPYLMCVDGEGGIVSRLASGTRMTGSMAIGATGDAAEDNAYATGKVIGEEVAAAGFNVDFAPDADVNSNPANPAMGTRSFSDDPQAVATLGVAFARGLDAAGVIGTYKHFPGHGDTGTDTHLDVSTVSKTSDELAACELVPFQHAIAEGADLVMTAHITLPEYDDTVAFADGTQGCYPATMSHKVLTDLLRDEMGYDGVIVTDALEMEALYQVQLVEGGGPTEEERLASAEYGANLACKVIEAGGDLLLIPFDLRNAEAAAYYDDYIAALVARAETDAAFAARIDESVARILALKERHGILDADVTGANVEQQATAAERVIGSAEHRAIETDIARQAITLLKNEGGALPLAGHGGNVVIFARDSDSVATVEYAVRQMQDAGAIDPDAFVENLENGVATGDASSGTRITLGFYRDYPEDADPVAHYTDEMRQAVAQADAVLAFSVTYGLSALQPESDQFQALSQIMADTHGAGAAFVLISNNLPYDAARYQDADALLCCYMAAGLGADPTDPTGKLVAYNANVVCALEAAFGAAEPTGTLPVNIPALTIAPDGTVDYADETLYARGFGLTGYGAAEAADGEASGTGEGAEASARTADPAPDAVPAAETTPARPSVVAIIAVIAALALAAAALVAIMRKRK